MNENRDFERHVQTWLEEEGPQDVPERIVDIAIKEAATSRRLRPLPRVIQWVQAGVESFALARQIPVTGAWLALVLLLTLLVATVVVGAFLFQVDRLRSNGPIAFDLGGDIWIVGSNIGDKPVQHTTTLGLEEENPVWSPDGGYLAYWVTDVSTSEIHVFDQEEGRTIVLRPPDGLLLPLHQSIFGWSPDGSRLAAPARGASADGSEVGIETVVVFEIDSGSAERIPFEGSVWSFGWSPDGRLMGLVGSEDLYLFDIETAELRPLRGGRVAGKTGTPYWNRQIPPVFSLDGRAVLFTDQTSEDGSDGDIWSFLLLDQIDEPVVASEYNELAPVVSRDGNHLAFARSTAVTIDGALWAGGVGPHKPSEIFVMPASGGEATSIVTGVWPRAVWSPDSHRLVTKSSDESELVVIDLDRPNDPIRIPVEDGGVGSYSWGPQPP